MKLFNTHETAETTRLTPRLLALMRINGTGPRYVKLGRQVFYDAADVVAWIDGNKRSRTSNSDSKDATP
jgi:hypothetical protein